MEIQDFFGLDFSIKRFEINTLLDLLGIRRKIEETSQVKKIIERFGMNSPYTNLAKRQQTLNYFKPLIENAMQPHNPLYYVKAVNTATENDRFYNAEERLLELVLIVASGKTNRELLNTEYKPSVKVLRNIDHSERFDRLWEILSQESREVIESFKKEK